MAVYDLLLKDEVLMAQYVNGDLMSFNTLYHRHKEPVYRFVMRQVGDQDLAEDIFQELWSKVISGAAGFNQNAKFTTWLYTIARNNVIDNKRHMKVVDGVFENRSHSEAIASHDPEKDLQTHRATQVLQECLTQINPKHLECILLKQEANLKIHEVAQVIGCTLDATKSRIRNAFKLVRQCVELKLG